MYAFGLVETGFYSEAEKHALKVPTNHMISSAIWNK